MSDIEYSPIMAEIEALVAGLTELRNENQLLKVRVLELERNVFNLPEDVPRGPTPGKFPGVEPAAAAKFLISTPVHI